MKATKHQSYLKVILTISLFTSVVACKTGGDHVEKSELKHKADCNIPLQLRSLALTCGNNKCEDKKFETKKSCPTDCLDKTKRIASVYAEAHICPEETIVHTPATPAEISSIVSRASQSGKKIKVVGTRHSASDIKCTSAQGETIVMERFGKSMRIEKYQNSDSLLVETGATMWDIEQFLQQNGYALPPRVPGIGSINVGGFLAVGAHGSNLKDSASISSSVLELELVLADGSIKRFDKTNTSVDQWKALRSSLGLLGVVTKMRLAIRKSYHMHVKVLESPDSILNLDGEKFFRELTQCEFAFSHYVRNKKKFYTTCGWETNEPLTSSELENTLFKPNLGETDIDVTPLTNFLLQQTACSETTAEIMEKAVHAARIKSPWIQYRDQNGKLQALHEGVGIWNRMMTTLLEGKYRVNFSTMDWEVAVPKSQWLNASRDMQEFMTKYNIVIPTIGVIFRYDTVNDDSLFAPSAADEYFKGKEPLVLLEMPVFVPFGLSPEQLENYIFPYRSFFLSLIEKYNARPHLGKNDNTLLLSYTVRKRLSSSIQKFAKVRVAMDPKGVFSNEFSSKMGL